MAINTQKLLPPSKFSTPTEKTTSVVTDRGSGDNSVLVIRKKLITIDKLLKNSLLQEKKEIGKKKRKKQIKSREEREKNIETPKGLKVSEKVKSLIPATGILDAVQRFVTFTFVGWLFTKFSDNLPKLIEITKNISPIINTAEKIIGGIFEGVVGFIDAGYKTVDNIRKLSKDIGGEKAQKIYDDFTKNFNYITNAILTLGLSTLVQPKPTPTKSNGGLVNSYAQGGTVTRGGQVVGGGIGRTLKTQPQKSNQQQKIRPQQTQPGKDVGGKKQIEKLYPNPKVTEKGKPNPYKVLSDASKSLKKSGTTGIIMASGIDLVLGQNLESNLLNSLTRDITLKSNINEILQNVRKEINKIPIMNGERFPGRGGRSSMGGDQSSTPDAYISENNKKAESDLLEYFSGLYGKTAAIGIVANLHRESGLRTVAPESGFNGMAQWDNTRWSKFKTWCKNSGKDPLSRSAQAQWIAIELNQSGISRRLSSAKTAEEASSIFYNNFERGAFSKPVVGADNYDPNNDHEQKNRGFIQQIEKRNTEFLKPQSGKSKIESDIMEFRKWRKQNYGVSDQRIASNQTGNLQVRELGSRGRGLLSTEINSLADDLNFEFWEHAGAGHRENRAFDIPVSDLKMGDRVSQFFKSRGYDIIWRAPKHFNHVHVEVPSNKAEEFFKIVGKTPKPPTTTKSSDVKSLDGKIWKKRPDGKWQTGSGSGTIIVSNADLNQRILESKAKPKPNVKPKLNPSWPSWLDNLNPFKRKPPPPSLYETPNPSKKQGGGFIGPQSRRNYSSLSSYPSYEIGGGMMIAVQPIIVEKPVPMPTGGNKSIIFPVPVSVNSNTASLRR